ncbi:hypothetical protein GGQ74_002920 [Desulfobaculum xiamenense]|uniref:Glycosyltransferase RgtA/B/C/D-like domain-containing protein n=1 Tax=Desulfobaculum xiamenense TaxID=995050 RepID=A0A846QS76_9BACT|nr:hypothetical protein [Desulfobaculum xiamenense]NJB69223.1 hypothetical protein [Desulfobaculum xiamenense]
MIENRNGLWPWAVAAILGVGVGARLVQVTGDGFGYDDYALMEGVDGPFGQYARAGAYLLPTRLVCWLVYRLLGGELWCFLLPAVLVGVGTLFVVREGLARHWPERFELHAVVLGLLAFSTHGLYVSGYASVTYAVSFFVACWLFFVFLTLAERDFGRREAVAHALLFVPAAFFSNVTILVPVGVGGAAALAVRLVREPGMRGVGPVVRALASMWPLAVFFVVHAALWYAFPFANLGHDARPDMRAYFLASSGFSDGGVLGVARFVVHGGLIMILQAFRQSVDGVLTMRGNLMMLKILAGVCAGCVAVVAFSRLGDGRLSRRALFVWAYLILLFVVTAAGGVAGVFPYGNLRYADALLLPMCVALATTFSPVQRVQPDVSRSTAAVVCLAVAAFGVFLVFRNHDELVRVRESNHSVLTVVRKADVPHIFYAAFQRPVLLARAPEIVRDGVPMGWGAVYGQTAPAEAALAVLDALPPAVIVIAPSRHSFDTAYSAYAEAFAQRGYRLTKYKDGANIWAAMFEWIGDEPPEWNAAPGR